MSSSHARPDLEPAPGSSARRPVTGRPLNIYLTLGALLSFLVMMRATGVIETSGGYGYDGAEYAKMVETGLDQGTPNTRLRPLVVLLARGSYLLTHDVLVSFRYLNAVFAAALALFCCLLADAYQARPLVKVYVVATISTSIATARMPAFYPVMVDLGAYVFIVAAVWAAVTDRRWLAALLAVLAAASREFGIMAAVFCLHRQIRTGVHPVRAVASCAPAVATAAAIRIAATSTSNTRGPISLVELLENTSAWLDPLYAAFYLYFLATVLGGLSLIIVTRPGQTFSRLRAEPEWITYAVPILIMSAIGSADLWRYIAFLLPLAVVLFVQFSRGWGRAESIVLCGVGAAGTWFTQRPFTAMDLVAYFRDWFPYYTVLGDNPVEGVELWPGWGWTFLVMCIFALVLGPRTSRVLRRKRGAGTNSDTPAGT